MKTQKIVLLVFAMLTFSGCGSKSDKQNDSNSTGRQPAMMDMTGESRDVSKVISVNQTLVNPTSNFFKDRMIIRKGSMNLETEKYDESERIILEETNKQNGYITNSNSSVNTSGKKQGLIEARVPAQNFDTFISNVSKYGKVMSLNVNGSDITEEYIDIEARHKTQKALEERLMKLLDEKTAKLTDIVEVEQKLADVRAQIESMEGRLRFLKNQSDYSTLSISLFEPSLLQTSSGGGFFYEIGEAFKEGLNGFTGVLTALITFMIAFSPVLIFGIIVFIFVRKYVLKRKNIKPESQVQAS